MTQIEAILANTQKQIEAQKQTDYNTSWASIKSGELATFNSEVETQLNEAITLLKAEAEEKKATKETELKAALESKIAEKYDKIAVTLKATIALAQESVVDS